MRIRSSLLWLVLATAIPLAVFGVVIAAVLVEHEHDNFVKVVKDRNRAFISAVDAELRGHMTMLQALAALKSLSEQDLKAFHRDAVAVLASQRDWENLILNDLDGRQLVNAVVPYGDPLPAATDRDSVRATLDKKGPLVVGLRLRPLTNTLAVPVRVPVTVDGQIHYVMTAVLRPELFARLLQQQNLPSTWVSGLVDAEGNFVARIPPRDIGTAASKDFRTALAAGDEGWYHGRTVEGTDTYTAFVKSEMSGWAIGLAVPSNEYWQSAIRAGWIIGTGALACVAVAVALAFWLGRRIATPIGALAANVADLETGRPVDVPTDIEELRELVHALDHAAQALAARRELSERERKLLEDADRAKDEFLAMLSHELRNPLAGIVTAAHLLKLARPGSEAVASAQGVIERQARQMTRLVEDLLDVSRIVGGKASLDMRVLDAAALVRSLAETWRATERFNTHPLAIRTLEAAWVQADAARIEQVVTNLLENATKFSAEGTPVSVDVRAAGDRVLITVADRGSGIEPDQLDRIFGLFVQGDQDLSRPLGGLGIGLALARKLLALHDGTIHAQSDGPGKGSQFVVSLPRVVAPGSAPSAPKAEPDKRRYKVLLVDDNHDSRDVMSQLLDMLGHEVRQAETGEEGLLMIEQGWPDLVLLDIGLPGIDGYEVARRVRARGSRVTLVALSGYGQPEDKRKARIAGFNLHLTKPISVENLEALLESTGRN